MTNLPFAGIVHDVLVDAAISDTIDANPVSFQKGLTMNTDKTTSAHPPFEEFIQEFKIKMRYVFREREDMNQLSTNRGLPPYVMRELMSCNPLATFIPAEYGGRGMLPHEGISVVEAASYESLALALIFGINWALFLQPVAKYGGESLKRSAFNGFLQERKMGGLMITEPDFGSDALHMQTSWSLIDGFYHLKGTKHWAGLTGWADYWLLTARKQGGPRGLGRDIDFFVCDNNDPGQRVVVEERYNNLGLYMIPYGRNHIDVWIPEENRLVPHSTGVKMMLDLLHRSRMQFPSMAMGFLTRLLDEATRHCRDRLVGNKALLEYDQVQARLAAIESAAWSRGECVKNLYYRPDAGGRTIALATLRSHGVQARPYCRPRGG